MAFHAASSARPSAKAIAADRPGGKNTVYLQQVVQTLRADGVAVRDEELARLPPARYEHINRLGKYSIPNQVEVEPNGLRSLRKLL